MRTPPEPQDANPAVAADWHSFPKTATYAPSTAARRMRFGIVPVLLACPAFIWPLVLDGTSLGVGGLLFLALTLLLLVLGACMIRYTVNARFMLDPHSIAIRGLGKGVVLPLSRIASLTATRQRNSGPYLVVLHATDGASSPKVFLEDHHLRDDDLLAWLAAVPRRGGVPVVRGKPQAKTSRVLIALAALALLPAVWVLVRDPIDTARALVFGYPPLERLSLVEGSVTHVGRCHPGGRGHSAYLPVTILTTAGPAAESLDCDVEAALRAPPGPHHVAVWRDKRDFSDGRVRQIEIDDRAMRDYELYIARNRHAAPYFLLGQLMLMASVALIASGMFAPDGVRS